jgi:uncharacterized protein GlcG (DUF336 family)
VKSILDAKLLAADAAHAMVQAALQAGRDMGVAMNCAVVDAGGNLLAFLREPGAPLHSIDIAIDKAHTAASFRCDTEALYAAIEEPASVRDGILARPRLAAFGGGLPIQVDGYFVGGIGVSGGSKDQDILCARAGLDVLTSSPSQV